ncbi:hypothetical protein [Natrarchaeobius chitinivorans]|uniref:Uncharacterized protein n=1 Tax=Natrarchaeobius chitinivorans TaxID=1679083 RepID=A0A3N6LMT4_NATCH|nr:hypothetical protein [Natrarchaeobius chitinivorans]RQG90573.1 hypothetical protein EA473_20705 [Natrarchaeobius chitinivorans]
MFGVLFLVLPIVGAYAVYVDAVDRGTDGPVWWGISTLAVGYGVGPIVMGLFLVLYLLGHFLEDQLSARRADSTA